MSLINFLMKDYRLEWMYGVRNIPVWSANKIIKVLKEESEDIDDLREIYRFMYVNPDYYEEFCDIASKTIGENGYAIRNELTVHFRQHYDLSWFHNYDTNLNSMIISNLKEYEPRFFKEFPQYYFICGTTGDRLEDLNIPRKYYASMIYTIKRD